MRIFMDQIPENVGFDDYPPDTEFVMDDKPPERDKETLRLIWPSRPIVTPEEAWKTYNQN